MIVFRVRACYNIDMWLLLFSPEYLLYTITGLVTIPGIIFASIAQARVHSTYAKYSAVHTGAGYTAFQIARAILDRAGLTNVMIIRVKGKLNCYYHHAKATLALSDDVYDSTSVAAIGVAAHEAGHALQYATGYKAVYVRQFLGAVSNVASKLTWPILIIGILLSAFASSTLIAGLPIGDFLIVATLVLFSASILFSLVTLPVEYNASRRAREILEQSGMYSTDEVAGARKVLSAAALTYVAALVTSILSMLRILLWLLVLFGGRRRK